MSMRLSAGDNPFLLVLRMEVVLSVQAKIPFLRVAFNGLVFETNWIQDLHEELVCYQ